MSGRTGVWLRGMLAALPALFAGVGMHGAAAHEVPVEVTVQVYLKPEAGRLHLLVRAPMAAMREIEFPMKGTTIDLARADRALVDAARLWVGDATEIHEGERRLATPRVLAARVSLESDRSFGSWETARAQVHGPGLAPDLQLQPTQGWFDAHLEYAIGDERAAFSIRPRFERMGLRTRTVLRFLPPGGAVRAYEFHGDPGVVPLDPSGAQAAWLFVKSGFSHILDGIDHLLFLLCLVLPFRRLKPLVLMVTAFTVGHSVTLVAAAYGFGPQGSWFAPTIETLIAVSILYMALENIVGASLGRRWVIAVLFGLVHGFAFAGALREQLQFAGEHLLASLAAFNVGIELGQLLVLVVAIPLLDLLFARVVAERPGIIIISALVAHTAWHWMIERGELLRRVPPPAMGAAEWAALLRWLLVALVVAAVVWGRRAWGSGRARQREAAPVEAPPGRT